MGAGWALDGKGKGDRIQPLGRVVEFFGGECECEGRGDGGGAEQGHGA